MPVSTVANVENNEIRIEKNNISGNILLALLAILLKFVSHYSAFFSIRRLDPNVLNYSKTFLSVPRTGKKNRE